MRTVIHATAVVLALECAALAAPLQAQAAAAGAGPGNRACALLTDAEIDAATGLDYDEPVPIDDPGPAGAVSCSWGGPSYMPGKSRPQLGVMLRPSPANTPFPAGPPRAGCTREELPGVGDKAFVDTCEKSRGPVAYMRVGPHSVLLQLDPEDGKPLASAKPALIALAKAAAARAKKL